MGKGQLPKVDEFAFVLLAGIILILILTVTWSTPTENPPIVEPTSFSRQVSVGKSIAFDMNITGKLTNVTLSSTGQIKNWIRFSKNNFDVADNTEVAVTISVPSTAITGITYSGNVIVQSTGGQKSIPINLDVVTISTKLLTRTITLGDFTVRYTTGSDILDSKDDVEVYKGYWSGNSVNLIGTLTDDQLSILKDGAIDLVIDETNSYGNLIVTFNNEQVYNQKVGAGELIIPVDKSLFRSSNTVTIQADGPGWMFWANTVYKFRAIELVANLQGIISQQIPFDLKQVEVDNFDRFRLSFIGTYTTPIPELKVRINNQIVYLKQPPTTLFNQTFGSDILGNNLDINSGENILNLEFEKQETAQMQGTVLTVYYTSPS